MHSGASDTWPVITSSSSADACAWAGASLAAAVPAAARAWLSGRGAAYGLCEVYGNEPWHYELRPQAVDHGCPAVYPDPTRDPRMQP